MLYTDRTFRDILRFGVEGVHFNYVTNDLGIKVAERTEQGNANWSMDGFVTGSVVNASCTIDSYYDWNEIYDEEYEALDDDELDALYSLLEDLEELGYTVYWTHEDI